MVQKESQQSVQQPDTAHKESSRLKGVSSKYFTVIKIKGKYMKSKSTGSTRSLVQAFDPHPLRQPLKTQIFRCHLPSDGFQCLLLEKEQKSLALLKQTF